MNASEIVSVALEPVHPLYMWQHKARVNMVKVNAHNDMLMYDGSRSKALLLHKGQRRNQHSDLPGDMPMCAIIADNPI